MDVMPIQFVGLVLLAAAGFLAFWFSILLEWNLGLEDPDMNLAQMIWAVSVVIMTAYFVVELKSIVVLSGLAMIVVCANRLTRMELFIFATYSFALYAGSVFYKAQFVSLPWITELVGMIAFGLVLVFGPLLSRLEMVMVDRLLIDKNEELTDALDQIRSLTLKDELTNVHNRQHLMDVLTQQKAMADRQSDDHFTLCFVDLDFLNRVNEKFGHSTGSQVLAGFASIVKSILREVDCIARIGEEKFVLVFGGATESDALVAARRIADKLIESQVSSIEPLYQSLHPWE
jgi:diguanylate cyclase (GGDEF)-like protein